MCNIKIKQGNLLEEPNATFIVNASNTKLILGSGVSAAFKLYCGYKLQEEMNNKLNKTGKLQKGDVVITSSGNAKNFIYSLHAIIMDYNDGIKGMLQYPSINNIKQVLVNIEYYLTWYLKNHKNSIIKLVLPLLGCGVGGLDKKEVLKCYIDFFKKKNISNCQVVIFGYDYQDYKLIYDFFKQIN